ncbi:hypothetical protein [Marilutibacter aestuarii]|uniref:Lipoprotein n=1 Tax=Marilutibacter aestuarii TaxID=1706195 RepID=A0A508ASE5_9GAMM|nr:hypothetical protein [Lysobacter aestuarii]TQD51401.1 hypothetical protein FKV25_01390 [Lysobacter aestuarii]
MNPARASSQCLLALAIASTALVACQPGPDPQQQQAARAEAREQAAEAMAAEFDKAYAAENWNLARAHGDILNAEYPGSAAAERIQARYAEARDKAREQREGLRLAGLWTYQTQPFKDGLQVSASLYSREPVDTDGSGAHPVQLIFRDNPDWGRSSYLVLKTGDFDCYGGCKVKLVVDDGEPRRVDASRPKTDEAIAMFIEDEAMLWQTVKSAGRIAIEFPVKAGGTRTAEFEVGGLAPEHMPGWR